MAEIAFDTLQYARRLKEAGVPEQQAEVQAKLMAEAFGYYIGNLVTRDYLDARLDARFAEQDARFEQRFQEQKADIDRRFREQKEDTDQHFREQKADIDRRFREQKEGTDQRFREQTASIHELSTQIAVLRMEMLGYFKLHSWMLALLSAAILGPIALEIGKTFLNWAY